MNWLGLPWPLWQAFFLSLELASITAALLWLIGLPLAHWLNQTRFIGRPVLEALIALPIVLPPTVIGFYLLVACTTGAAWARLVGRIRPDASIFFPWTGGGFYHIQSAICSAAVSGGATQYPQGIIGGVRRARCG
jgi:ABC-type molybdate transport system permease subunit